MVSLYWRKCFCLLKILSYSHLQPVLYCKESLEQQSFHLCTCCLGADLWIHPLHPVHSFFWHHDMKQRFLVWKKDHLISIAGGGGLRLINRHHGQCRLAVRLHCEAVIEDYKCCCARLYNTVDKSIKSTISSWALTVICTKISFNSRVTHGSFSALWWAKS